MKWANIVSITVWALSGAIFVITANVNRPLSRTPSAGVVDSGGIVRSIEDVLPAGAVGLITVAAIQPEPHSSPVARNAASGADDGADSDVRADNWLTTPKPETSAQKSRSGASVKSSSKSKSKSKAKTKAKTKTKIVSAEPLPCVDINAATESDLITLKGIGPALAARIIEHRAEHGDFTRKEDLQKVKGIGPAKYSGVVDRLCDFDM